MAIRAPSEREAFKGVEELYARDIEPYLRSREDARQRAVMEAGLIAAAMETGDRLNTGAMFAPLQGPERVERILKQFD